MYLSRGLPITDNMVVGQFTQETDLVVIGGGPGGYSAAFRAAELGVQTIIVDPKGSLGGVCLYHGCIQSKTVLAIGQTLRMAADAAKLGVHFNEPRVDLGELRQWMSQTIGKLASGLDDLAKKRGVEVLKGAAHFDDQRQLSIHNGTGSRVRFKRAIIATGAQANPPPGGWVDSPRLMDPGTALELDEIPASLLVIGSGYIALELATLYAALGSKVTLVTQQARILAQADADLTRPLARRLGEVLEDVCLQTTVTDLREVADGIEAALQGPQETSSVVFDSVVAAIGRHPNIDSLNLPKAHVQLDDSGYVRVNEQLRTSNARILGVGDITGKPMLADKAIHQGRIAGEVVAGWGSEYDPRAVPFVVFTDPQVAWCGLTEAQAATQGIDYQTVKIPWGASGRAVSLGRSDGMTKLIYDPDTKLVLGVGIVGLGAAEMIAQGILALEMGAVTTDLASSIFPHPTMSELLGEAAARVAATND